MADRSPGDFGRKLREARERRGVSLRQIANATKISISALDAIERNDISRLPGGIFSRAFVRSFAIEVGLDPEATIQDFIAQFPQDSVTAGHPTFKRGEDHEAIEHDRRTATTFLRLIAVSIPIVGAVLYFGVMERRASSRASLPDPPTAATAPAAAAPAVNAPAATARAAAAPATTLPAPAAPATLPAAPAAGSPADPVAATPARSDRFTVELSATRECLISATVDDERTVEQLMQPGDRRTMEVRRELVLTAGDAGAIVMMLNGAEAKPLGKQGEMVTARLNLTNFREYLSNR